MPPAKNLWLASTVLALGMCGGAAAADLSRLAALTPFSWTGLYAGTHFGYTTGSANWSAIQPGVPNVAGSLDLFSRMGGLIGGFQVGYLQMLPSRAVVGVEANVSFPNLLAGQQTLASPAIGQATYAEAVEMFGTLRGRLGYAFDHWLVYATGGFAWTYDKFTRTQLVGTPLGGTAFPGVTEELFRMRAGWTVGAGIEAPFVPFWTARLEYLYSDFGNTGVTFPAGVQRFDSDLNLHQVRFGLNYRPDSSVDGNRGPLAGAVLDADRWRIHGQTTYVHQYAPPFHAPYRGTNSFLSNIGRQTWDATLYLGLRLWQGAELWVNPEIDQGFGLSNTLGVAGFTSGEAYKLGATYPYTRLHRAFLRQTVNLGGAAEKLEDDINQFGGKQSADRLVFTIGKFSVGDIFDTNKYAHDPRNDFLNWSIIDVGTFDYAADAWGYTIGAAAEWYQGRWTLRAGLFDLSIVPNSTILDPDFSQFQTIAEIEERHDLWGQPGKVKVNGFLSRGRMGRFDDAIRLSQVTGPPADISAVRRYNSRSGVSVNLEQQLSPDVGVFARAGWADGRLESYEFTDIDRSISAGLSANGRKWGRPDDTVGLAGVVNDISGVRQAFLNAGGLGILVGDGQLPNPGREKIVEVYYSFPIYTWRATLDYQFIANPAYNRDRGPVSVLGLRIHSQF